MSSSTVCHHFISILKSTYTVQYRFRLQIVNFFCSSAQSFFKRELKKWSTDARTFSEQKFPCHKKKGQPRPTIYIAYCIYTLYISIIFSATFKLVTFGPTIWLFIKVCVRINYFHSCIFL